MMDGSGVAMEVSGGPGADREGLGGFGPAGAVGNRGMMRGWPWPGMCRVLCPLAGMWDCRPGETAGRKGAVEGKESGRALGGPRGAGASNDTSRELGSGE